MRAGGLMPRAERRTFRGMTERQKTQIEVHFMRLPNVHETGWLA